ncbi:hypothetical protein QJS66_00480 [Kocuria rhizophila]|nr:hypothetical protein QJS66_00480 [Kocuria rhizophila]
MRTTWHHASCAAACSAANSVARGPRSSARAKSGFVFEFLDLPHPQEHDVHRPRALGVGTPPEE